MEILNYKTIQSQIKKYSYLQTLFTIINFFFYLVHEKITIPFLKNVFPKIKCTMDETVPNIFASLINDNLQNDSKIINLLANEISAALATLIQQNLIIQIDILLFFALTYFLVFKKSKILLSRIGYEFHYKNQNITDLKIVLTNFFLTWIISANLLFLGFPESMQSAINLIFASTILIFLMELQAFGFNMTFPNNKKVASKMVSQT